MKRVTVLLVALALLTLTGCFGGALDEEFVAAVDANWSVIGPDYTRYLQADGVLSEQSKMIRLRAVAEFTLLIKEAKGEEKGGTP